MGSTGGTGRSAMRQQRASKTRRSTECLSSGEREEKSTSRAPSRVCSAPSSASSSRSASASAGSARLSVPWRYFSLTTRFQVRTTALAPLFFHGSSAAFTIAPTSQNPHAITASTAASSCPAACAKKKSARPARHLAAAAASASPPSHGATFTPSVPNKPPVLTSSCTPSLVSGTGYVNGRGAIDDKQAVVAICEAVEGLLAKGFEPAVPVLLLFGHDEEIGGYDGAKALAAKAAELVPPAVHGAKPLSFVLDEGLFILSGFIPGMAARVAAVCVAEKGHVNMEIVARQPAGHSSAPPKSSSIGTLARAVRIIEENPFPAHLSAAARLFDALIPDMPAALAYLFSNTWLFGPLLKRLLGLTPATNAMVRTTTAVTIARAGYKSNVLPPLATAVVNHRIHPDESVSFVQKRYDELLRGLPVTTRAMQTLEPAPVSSTSSPAFSALAASSRAVFAGPLAVAPALMVGNTDTRWYWNLAEDIYRHNPTELGMHEVGMFHGRDERIAVDNLARMCAFYAGVVARTAG